MSDDRRDVLKIVVLGSSLVGKSKLLERYLMDSYKPQEDSTYAVTLHEKTVEIDGEEVNIEWWDTAGQERFMSLHASFYYGSHAAILVFDLTNAESYVQLNTWYAELRQHCPNIPGLLAANKLDAASPKMTKKKYKFPIKHDLPFFYVSALDGKNVVRLFQEAECYS